MGRDVTDRGASSRPSARSRRRAGEVRSGQSSQQRNDRRAVVAYRVAMAALLVALAAADFVAFGLERFRLDNSTSTADAVADSAVYCGVMLGIAYYLGRTRCAPGSGQRLRWLGRLFSIVPIWGLIQISAFPGVNGLTKRRLCVRNIAITAGSVLVWSSWNDLRRPVAGSVAMAVVQVSGIVLAMLMSLTIPAKVLPEARKAPSLEDATARIQPRSAAEIPGDIPAADEIVDVSPLAAGARRLYWLAGAMKFGAIFLVVLPAGAQSHFRLFSWGIAGAGILAALAVSVLMQEDWIRPIAGFALALGLISAICFVPAAFGVLTASAAWQGLLLWIMWPLPFLWLYWRQRRSSGLSDAEIQAASRIGHLPRRQGGRVIRRVPPPGLWVRGIAGMLCAIPLVVAGLVNTIFGVMVIQNWIQAALDKLYAFARGSVQALLAGGRSEERIAVTLAAPPEAEAWQLQVRGDLLYWGKLSFPPLLALSVPFEEFLRARLEAYGEVGMIQETQRSSGAGSADNRASSLVVMPVGVPFGASYPSNVISKVAALGARMPLLLPVQPIGRRPLEQWRPLVRVMRIHGIALPAMDDPIRTIAVLHQAHGKKIVFTAQKRNQWGYIAVIHEIFRVISSSRVARPAEASTAGSGVLVSRAGEHRAGPSGAEDAYALLRKYAWNRDDLNELSANFDAALARASAYDIMRWAHVWLVTDPPQLIELSAGRRIGDHLVSAVEHRVVQLRRADAYIMGPERHALVRRELAATAKLLRTANCTHPQATRLLTAAGELAQLAACVAADGGMNATGYILGGVSAARAACNAPLAGYIFSTLSCQFANTGKAPEAVVLARTAYAGVGRQATPRTRALLLERIAWATAMIGDRRSCERALGGIDDNFAEGPRDNDPDWALWLNHEEIEVLAGCCYTELKKPRRAQRLLCGAIERYDRAPADEISRLSWLAESHIQLGEIDEAAVIGTRALELAVHAGPACESDRLHRLNVLLRRYKSVPEVAQFLDCTALMRRSQGPHLNRERIATFHEH
jgi:hypothetical protein